MCENDVSKCEKYYLEASRWKQEIIPMCQTNIGDLMVVYEDKTIFTKDDFVLNTSAGFINLNDPRITYNKTCTYLVLLLPKGTQISLTVK